MVGATERPRDPANPALRVGARVRRTGAGLRRRPTSGAAPRLGARFPLSLAKSPSVVREAGRTVSRAAAPGGASGRLMGFGRRFDGLCETAGCELFRTVFSINSTMEASDSWSVKAEIRRSFITTTVRTTYCVVNTCRPEVRVSRSKEVLLLAKQSRKFHLIVREYILQHKLYKNDRKL